MRLLHKNSLNKYYCVSTGDPENVGYFFYEVMKGKLGDILKFSRNGSNKTLNRLDSNWRMILEVLDYDTQGKRILDLGCGCASGNVESEKFDGNYAPWLGRFVSMTKDKTGLDYVGVDCCDNSKENFESRQIDLLKEGSLEREFPEGYFDLAVGFMLFNSPELERRVSGRRLNDAHGLSGKKLADIIIPQLEKIVGKDGAFLWSGGEEMCKY